MPWDHPYLAMYNERRIILCCGQGAWEDDSLRTLKYLAEVFRDAPANCWIGRAPFRGDKYLTQTDVADFRIYNYAVSNQEISKLKKSSFIP